VRSTDVWEIQVFVSMPYGKDSGKDLVSMVHDDDEFRICNWGGSANYYYLDDCTDCTTCYSKVDCKLTYTIYGNQFSPLPDMM
jgi:hypothetical protein